MGLPRWPDTEWWLAYVEGLPRWLWAVTLLWVGLQAAWACWVQAQTGRGADASGASVIGPSSWLCPRPPVGPRGLGLDGSCHTQDQTVRAAPAHELQPQRQPIGRPAARDRYRWLAG